MHFTNYECTPGKEPRPRGAPFIWWGMRPADADWPEKRGRGRTMRISIEHNEGSGHVLLHSVPFSLSFTTKKGSSSRPLAGCGLLGRTTTARRTGLSISTSPLRTAPRKPLPSSPSLPIRHDQRWHYLSERTPLSAHWQNRLRFHSGSAWEYLNTTSRRRLNQHSNPTTTLSGGPPPATPNNHNHRHPAPGRVHHHGRGDRSSTMTRKVTRLWKVGRLRPRLRPNDLYGG